MTWIRFRLAVLALLAGTLVTAGPTARADDPDAVERAKTLLSELHKTTASDRPDADLMQRLPAAHNGIVDKALRSRLRTAAGRLFRLLAAGWGPSWNEEKAFVKATHALLSVDPQHEGYAEIQKNVSKRPSGLNLAGAPLVLFGVLREAAPPAALEDLMRLVSATSSREPDARAIAALGGYGGSPEREAVLGVLLQTLARLRPSGTDAQLGPTLTEWQTIGYPTLVALEQLTGKSMSDPGAWLARFEANPDDRASWFEPGDALGPVTKEDVAADDPRPWKRIRASLPELGRKDAEAVDLALRWLAAHVERDGSWSAATFSRICDGEPRSGPRDYGAGDTIYDVGVTGLALQAFLVAGYDGTGTHAYDGLVERGLAWLLTQQDADGCFGGRVVSRVRQTDPPRFGSPWPDPGGPRRGREPDLGGTTERANFVYNHATATTALIEAQALTGKAAYGVAAQRGIGFIRDLRSPDFGWRFGGGREHSDTSVTSWMTLALGTARLVNLAHLHARTAACFTLPEEAFLGARAWLKRVTDTDYGRVGYLERGSGSARLTAAVEDYPAEVAETLTAAGMVMNVLLGVELKRNEVMLRSADLCLKAPPSWDGPAGTIDFIYWHFGALAFHQMPFPARGKWQKAMDAVLVPHQRRDGAVCDVLGSWDPVGAWGTEGGRVYATALGALTLLTPKRFPPLWR